MKKLLFFLLLIPCITNAQTVIFGCGGECGVTGSTGTHVISTNITGNAAMSTVQKRTGDRSWRFNPSSATSYFQITHTSANIKVLRFYLYFATFPNADAVIVSTPNASGTQPGLMFKNSDSKVYLGTIGGGSTFTFSGSSSSTLSTGVWYRIDLKINSTSSPNTLIDCNVDGSALTQASMNVATGGGTGNITFGTNASCSADFYLDDIVVSLTSANYPIGGGTVEHFIPIADGTHNIAGTNDFERGNSGTDILNATTTAYQLCNKVPLSSGLLPTNDYIGIIAPPNATDYVELLFGPAPGISTPTVAPVYMIVTPCAAVVSAGSASVQFDLNDNGSIQAIVNASVSSTTIAYWNLALTDPPSAATSWTLSGDGNFNNLKIRMKSNDAAPDIGVPTILIEAVFAEVSNTVPGTPSDKRHTTLGVGGLAATQSLIKTNINEKTSNSNDNPADRRMSKAN